MHNSLIERPRRDDAPVFVRCCSFRKGTILFRLGSSADARSLGVCLHGTMCMGSFSVVYKLCVCCWACLGIFPPGRPIASGTQYLAIFWRWLSKYLSAYLRTQIVHVPRSFWPALLASRCVRFRTGAGGHSLFRPGCSWLQSVAVLALFHSSFILQRRQSSWVLSGCFSLLVALRGLSETPSLPFASRRINRENWSRCFV